MDLMIGPERWAPRSPRYTEPATWRVVTLMRFQRLIMAMLTLRRDRKSVPFDEHHLGATEPLAPELDDELRLAFLCCHPALPRAAQIALTLRIAYGFDTRQIARAFLSDERTIAQRIVRAKQRLREEGARTYAELHASLGHIDEARAFPDRALEQQTSPAERALSRRKRAALA
jgi:predicted RNA polymerase sigma factor